MESIRDQRKRLVDQVEFPSAWSPSKEDEHPRTIAGLVTADDTVAGKDDYGKEWTCRVYTLEDEVTGKWAVWTWHTVLRNELVDKVEIGDFVALSFIGFKTSKNTGGEYPAYRVAIDKKPAPEDEFGF